MIKKISTVFICLMLLLTMSFNTPQEVKAEPEVKALINNSTNIKLIEGPVLMSLLVSTVVSVLLSIGISITRYGVEQLFKQWNINAEEYGEELNNQFNTVGDKLIVGAKTLALAYRVRKELLSQGLTNNGSINIGSSSVNPGYTTQNNTTVLSNIYGSVSVSYNGSQYNTLVNRTSKNGTPNAYIVFGLRYYLIQLDNNKQEYYIPKLTIDNTTDFKLSYLNLVFTDKQSALNFIGTFKNNEMMQHGSYYYNYNPSNIKYGGSFSISDGKFTIGTNSGNKYAVIVYTIQPNGNWTAPSVGDTAVHTSNITITKNPNTESNIPIVSESTETVTAGKIDLTDWQNINPNYTLELELENNNQEIINSNQALIDAITQNTVAIKNQQVIDKETGLTVTDINTNVIGISGILNGISNVITSIKEWFISLVQPITNIFTKTYTIEEINSIAWVNAINELVLTIQNGITQILPFYLNNVGSILNNISHPQSNLLTQAVNTILTNSNLYWAVYGIAAIIFIKGVLR